MAKKPIEKTPVSEAQIAAYDRLLATHPEIQRKGKNLLYTSVNGHMFTVFSTDALLGIRLSKEDRSRFLEEYDSELLKSYGAVMREYVTIPPDLLDETETLAPWLHASWDYVTSLAPKPTKKPKKK
ncbi:MAG: hypothetical protein AAF389_14205 [Gemmatimonadota bacterium]